MSQFQKFEEDFTHLLEGGFLAANQADEDASKKLFAAAQLLKPASLFPKIGLGYIHLLKMELKLACANFQEVLDKESDNELARSLLGLSYALTTKEVEKGEELLHESITKTQDSHVKSMAQTAIEFVEKYIKKSPTPVQGQPDKKKATHD
jgi:tetratricopeptide (TPR) repeat protein